MKSPASLPNEPVPVRRDRWGLVLLVIVTAVTVLRATFIEVPRLQGRASADLSENQIQSLLFSTVLLVCWAWFIVVRILQNRLCWRRTGFGLAWVVFVAAGCLAASSASNRRAAITDLAVLTAPVAGAVMLAQVLNSPMRIRLVLFVLLAIGVSTAAMCADQSFSSNDALIADYQGNPQAHLLRLGIEPGSLEQWMYEHRLYSKGARGFLLTGNSTATFLLLAVFAGLGLCADAAVYGMRLDTRLQKEQALAALICYALATLAAAAGLLMTRSKGGVGALAIGLILFLVLSAFGPFVWKRRRLCGGITFVLIAAGAAVTIGYGLRNGRLPGGNSMLVRWQYWTSAAEMIADHPLTGVGGGNFATFYPAYKVPAASETVQDPHNWVLSLLSQYGPWGLLAFAAAMAVVVYKALRHRFTPTPMQVFSGPAIETGLWTWMLLFTAILLLVVRPLIVGAEFLFTENAQSAAFGYVLLYVVPAAVFAGVFVLLAKAAAADASVQCSASPLNLALVCGLAAVLIHNLIDFAIFEPGVWGCLWLTAAALVANIHNESARPRRAAVLGTSHKTAAILGLFILVMAFLMAAVIGPIKAHRYFAKSLTSEYGRLDWVQKAVEADPLSPDAAYRTAAMMAEALKQTNPIDKRFRDEMLELAELAHRRDPADFKPLRLQAEIFSELAKKTQPQKQWLSIALTKYEQALQRYPGSDRMYFDAAQTAEALGNLKFALLYYQAAVQIEDAYRKQFKRMYPQKTEIISRLGPSNYQKAKTRITELEGKIDSPGQLQ